ncbi:MAG: hypothetical protein HY040_13145 [Planctomycetes bacterium]|nr:hypothetical protein [Planctomycetota bacterium]
MKARKTKSKPYWEMNKEELAEATREFDQELAPDTFHSLSPQKQLVWERLQKEKNAKGTGPAAPKKRHNKRKRAG